MNLKPSTLKPKLRNLNPRPEILNSECSSLNPQTSTLNPQPSSLNPPPSTLNPQPSTLRLKILDPEHGEKELINLVAAVLAKLSQPLRKPQTLNPRP